MFGVIILFLFLKIIYRFNRFATIEGYLSLFEAINDSLDPVPDYKLEIKNLEGKQIIILDIFKGKHTPYYYKGKAYRRLNTSTLEVDRLELNRLVMEGINIDYEEMKSLLTQYDKTIGIFERYYQYEEIEGYERVRKELIPREAFRESLANAIVHRVWDVKTHIQIFYV